MSFITKRERVFNEYDVYDLPSRNEGKLKAYSSCTDARAWSHFCSDKAEHLVEIIKKNNESCRPKYLPTDVIVNTLMVTKNAEIGRLKRKIEEFEQMLAAYDQLELTSEQKCDIAGAHASIKAANKELDEMCLDLDLSGFTEGIDSEAFETGKSRGDETMRSIVDETQKSKGDESGKSRSGVWEFTTLKLESKSNQVGQGEVLYAADASTYASDPRIDDMQEMIIRKDAKLNAMQNKIAVLETDICEPYCLYAHIYTALEKIFSTLCQNGKYKHYLNLLTADKDTRSIDIKGKILFKMKVLEKFCLALIAPCSQDYEQTSSAQDCSCYRAEIVTTLALTTAECGKNSVDDRRAQLVADIIDNQEMKEILSKESVIVKSDNKQDEFNVESDHLETDSLNRLKNLQANYDDLVKCYDNLKFEKDALFLRCQKYIELEKECQCMQEHLREYNQLWSEKEYYRKRSEDLDILKERYYILSDETCNVEAKLQAESEINRIKCKNIDYLQNENIALEKKLQELTVLFEREKSSMNCKLKEYECKITCQDQQIKTLSLQIDKFIEQGHEIISEDTSKSVELLNEIESQKEQINNLRQALLCNEEEKQVLQDNFQEKLELINELKLEIENWKEKSDKLLHSNICLEEYARDYQNQIQYLQKQNHLLSNEIEGKNKAIENFKEIIDSKAIEINSLTDAIEAKDSKNILLLDTLKNTEDMYTESLQSLKTEKDLAIDILKAKQNESREILHTIRTYLYNDPEQNKPLSINEIQHGVQSVDDRSDNNNNKTSVLLNEINKLHDLSVQSLHSLLDENVNYKDTLDLSRRQRDELEKKVKHLEELTIEYHDLKYSYEILLKEKGTLEDELKIKNIELDDLINSFQLTKKESEDLNKRLNQSESLKEEFVKINVLYKKLIQERSALHHDLTCKEKDLENIQKSLNKCTQENEILMNENRRFIDLDKNLADLKVCCQTLETEKKDLNSIINDKAQEIKYLYENLENKIEENEKLLHEIEQMKIKECTAQSDITTLKDKNLNVLHDLTLVQKESDSLLEKVKYYENLQLNFDDLKQTYDEKLSENQTLKMELDKLKTDLQEITKDNNLLTQLNVDLSNRCQDLSARAAMNEASPKNYLEGIKEEIERMKKDKIVSHKKIRELADKLDESDAIILNLQEDIITRDSKIATLQNYINELQAEVTHLNNNIAYAVESSEQLLSTRHTKMDESLKQLEEHHFTAIQKIEMELSILKTDNVRLENQLLDTKAKLEEFYKEKQNLTEEITYLQDEKSITLQNIKQLEINCFGDSSLSLNDCSIDDVVTSFNRIRQCIESKHSRSASLEQKLLTVQNSSKLLLNKADEAKKIVENEKQKILTEKEEAIKEREIMENRLIALEAKLREQIEQDQEIIKDLDAKLLNQKLMFEKIDEVRQKYVTKLETEIHNMEDMYKKSLSKIRELQDKLLSASEDNTKKIEDIDVISKSLEKKSKEVNYLRKCLDDIKNKPSKTTITQTDVNHTDVVCQTDLFEQTEKEVNTIPINDIIEKSGTNVGLRLSRDLTKKHKPSLSNHDELLLTSSNLDFIKKVYLDYKMKKLSPTKLEQCIISGNNSDENYHKVDSIPGKVSPRPNANVMNDIGAHHKIIDIYNTHSIFTHNTEYSSKSPDVESTFDLSNEDSKEYAYENKPKTYDFSGPSTDNDLFLIYKDSDDVNRSDPHTKSSLPDPLRSTILGTLNDVTKATKNDQIFETKENELLSYQDDDSVKPKLTLSLPRVASESLSRGTNSEYDKKSIDSYTVAIYTSPITMPDEYDNISILTNSPAKDLSNFIDSHKSFAPIDLISEMRDDLSCQLNSPRKIPVINQIKKVDKRKKEKIKISPQRSENERLTTELSAKMLNKGKLQKTTKIDDKNMTLKENIVQGKRHSNYGLKYILDSVQQEINIKNFKNNSVHRSHSDNIIKDGNNQSGSRSCSSLLKSFSDYRKSFAFGTEVNKNEKSKQSSYSIERGVMAKLDNVHEYENKIKDLTDTLENIEKHYQKKIEAVKTQYDNNIKNIINEHNQGVESIQSLHDETLQDFIKSHESEVENLRTMSIEAMRKVEKLEKENRVLRIKLQGENEATEEPIKFPDTRKRRHKRSDTRKLTTTNIEAFNLKPKPRAHGPCTCTLDTNISDTIRTIFEQVDVDQRRMAEQAYTKYIANKIINNNVEALDAQELAFLHLKVCRTWKCTLSEEEVLQKRIDSLENELMNKQRQTKIHIAELDRKVAVERRRLEEVREAVCRNTPAVSRDTSPQTFTTVPEKESCKCCSISCTLQPKEKLSSGDLVSSCSLRPRWPKQENNRAVTAKLDAGEQKEKKHFHDEHPIRLRRSHDRTKKTHKK
ncbi:reticulocyte-binding protein homolog 2a [Pieris rapae]|uniref:reticulocyte-binding protein homolog 2a n=1 Tax=Pieris rapae TaxID=64459 RepID=UPI001E27DBFD|nr:reticulocyte-binding protein homolog 2a [Pieris rapae]